MTDGFLRNIRQWVAEGVAEEHSRRVPYDGGAQMLLGGLVWGRYVKRFVRHCVPSLGAEGNLRALSARPTLMIHTDKKSLDQLGKGLQSLAPFAQIFAHPIADDLDVLLERNRDNRYVLLGASEVVSLKRARFRGMHYHQLFPDVVYPEGYFRRLEGLALRGHKAILTHSINATLEGAGPSLRKGVSAGRLANIALANLHPRQKPYFMNGRRDADNVPLVPHLLYVQRDRISIAGMHASVVFLHNDLLSFEDLHLNATLDAQLPYYIPAGTPLYMPQVGDEMTLVELSDAKWGGVHKRTECSLHEFALRFWAVAKGEPGFEDIFGTTCEFPLESPPPMKSFTQGEVDRSLARIRSYVHQIHPEVVRAFDMGGIIEESGVNGPLQLPQDRIKEAVLAARPAS